MRGLVAPSFLSPFEQPLDGGHRGAVQWDRPKAVGKHRGRLGPATHWSEQSPQKRTRDARKNEETQYLFSGRERNGCLFMGSSGFDYEVLTSGELAQRLKVKESWVVDQSKRCRTHDPIPVFRLGKHRRYRWGSPEMNAWLDRRAGYNTQRKAEPKHKEER